VAADRDALVARIDTLERERRRAFDDAQREADALFAQYQLSQLIASGGQLGDLAAAVLLELIRLADAAGGALWLGRADGGPLERIAVEGVPPADPPDRCADPAAATAWVSSLPGARAIVLSDGVPATVVGLWPTDARPLDDDGLRITQLARHELAVAFQGARLREALDQEREELEAIVDGATDLILQVDADRRVVRLNPAGERLVGSPSGAAVGRTCADVLGCEVAGGHGEAACPLAEVLATGSPISYRETAIRGAGGPPIGVAGSYAAASAAGRETRATAILRDISAVRALQELREGFVATVSHELRTPLALIRGYAESLLHLPLPPDQQRAYVERIDDASGRLVTLVEEILDVTHLQADPLILERGRVTLASLVARLKGDLDVAGGADRLVVDAPDDLPPLDVDIVRAGQVLSNVVGNALKYAPPPTPVTLGARVDGRWLVVTVDDDGIGIPESEQALVSEPFHRAWNVRESRIPGTGLGLFISRRLVEAHGGELRVADRPDGRHGTRVRFTLPLATAPETADG
jgi:signal transduction histidine kinase